MFSDECRRKKIKCQTLEGSKTCRNCIANRKGCTFNTRLKKRGPRKGHISAISNRLLRIEEMLTDLTQHTVSSSTNENTQKDIKPKTINQISNADNVDKTYLEDNKVKAYNDKNPQARATWFLERFQQAHLSNEGRFISEHSLISYIAASKLKTNRTKEWLSKYDMDIQYNYNGDYIFIKKKNSSNDRREEQIKELIQVGIIKPHETVKDVDEWIFRVARIDRSLSDRLLKIYFAYIHPLLPVINKATFLEEYRGIQATFPAAPLLNAIYGASARYILNCEKFNDLERLEDGGSWDFSENFATGFLQRVIMFAKARYVPRLSSIQAIIIAHNHCANIDSWTTGWLFNCIAVRMSQDLGLHRSTEEWTISEQDKETRRMVFWSVYVCDRWFSAGTGRPLTIFDEDCDELYPSENVSLDEFMDTPVEKDKHFLPRFPSLGEYLAAKVTDNTIPMYQPFIQLLKLSEILGRILQGMYTPKAKANSAKYGNDAIVAYLDGALSKWRASLPPLLGISTTGENDLQNKDHVPLLSMSGLICVSYYTVLILLHRPFIEKNNNGEKSNLPSQSSLAICTSAAIRIVEVSEKMHFRDFLMLSWGFAIYPAFTAALIHVYNYTNPDSLVSGIAKSYLMRALVLIDKLCLLSPMANNMANVLKRLIMMSPKFINDPELKKTINTEKNSSLFTGSPTENRQNDIYYKSQNRSCDHTTEKKRESDNILLNDDKIDELYHFLKQLNDEDPQKPVLFGAQQQRRKESENNKTTTLPSWDEDWLSHLYAQNSADQKSFNVSKDNQISEQSLHGLIRSTDNSEVNYISHQSYQQNPSLLDTYSIRQFGFHTMLNTNEQPQPFPFIVQPTSYFNHYSGNDKSVFHSHKEQQYDTCTSNKNSQKMLPIPAPVIDNNVPMVEINNAAVFPMHSANFDISDISYGSFITSNLNCTPTFERAQSTNCCNSNIIGSSNDNISSSPNVNNNYSTAASSISSNSENRSHDPSAIFRPSPNNPFWGIPSSMEVNEWNAYLFPRQQQN
ncbi:MAG: fungal-specific transcription factor domain-containing protein [Benjaminiella poitrasii]|nr:MAG: fungal-specific transcription factor domain-containing protein [Benjaminiella poitrasii]